MVFSTADINSQTCIPQFWKESREYIRVQSVEIKYINEKKTWKTFSEKTYLLIMDIQYQLKFNYESSYSASHDGSNRKS
jgi:hypothetical protein